MQIQIEDVIIYQDRLLGAGQFGEVYLGSYNAMKVAVKQIKKKKIKSTKNFEQLEREIKITQWLRHDHIAKVYKVIRQDYNIYIIMEFCNGPTLKQKIDKVGLSSKEIQKYLFQIVSAMFYLQKLKRGDQIIKISHRDLKPQNIILNNECIKIVDFGLAKVIDDEEDENQHTFVGTANYASPQLIISGNYNPEKNDIWSIGIIAYYMVCKSLPWKNPQDEVHFSLSSYIYSKEINLLKSNGGFELKNEQIDEQIEQFIDRCLKFNEEQRATFKELYEMDYFNSENVELQKWKTEQEQTYKQIKQQYYFDELKDYYLVKWILDLKQQVDTKQKQKLWDQIYTEILEMCQKLPISYFRLKQLERLNKKYVNNN